MKLLRQLFFTVVFIAFMLVHSNIVNADIPYELEFTVVFNYEDAPIDGEHNVVFRLYTSSELVYMEKVKNVDFDRGVAKVVVGGEDSDLINAFFDNTDMDVSFSVLQHQLFFPIQTVPYTIRAKEANKARRIDNEDIIYFDEPNERVGVSNLVPEVSLDINGGIKVGNLHPSDNISNGVIYWHGNSDSFYGYSNGEWKTMSYYPDESDQSKWTISDDELWIYNAKPVGIGMSPNTFGLGVSGNIRIYQSSGVDGDLFVGGDVFLTESLLLDSGYGITTAGQLLATKLVMPSGNSWINGNINFTGVLHGNGEDLTTLSQFGNYVFESIHFEDQVLFENHILDDIIQLHHIAPGSINTANVVTGHVNEDYIVDYSIQSQHIVDGTIRMHHMMLNEISSSDIKFNVFSREKFKNDVILTSHIVDQQIGSNKVVTESIGAHKIQDNSITSAIIKNYTIDASKIPIGTIATDNLDFVFPLDKGGTAQTAFDEYGVLFVTPAGDISANAEILSVVDGRFGLGAVSSNVTFLVQDAATTSVLIRSEDDYVTTLVMENNTTSMNLEVDSAGHLNIIKGSENLMTFDNNGFWGIATANPTESLTLSGPILLGEPNATAGSFLPGTMYYSGGQFYLCLTSNCDSMTFASLYQRSFQMDEMVAQSSVIFSDQTTMLGQRLFVNDVQNSDILADFMMLNLIRDSDVAGVQSRLVSVHDSSINVVRSEINDVVNTLLKGESSRASAIHDATMVLANANAYSINDSNIDIYFGKGSNISNSHGVVSQSDMSFIDDSTVDAYGSQGAFINQSLLKLDNSDTHFLNHSRGYAKNSMLDRLNQVSFSVEKSLVSNVFDSYINSEKSMVVDIEQSMIIGDHVLAMNGRDQDIQANHVVAIGDHITSNHDHTTLINASSHSLTSDRDGQVKIQADGDIRIQFTDEVGLSMVDGIGRQISDRNLKFKFSDIDVQSILNKVRELPVYYWKYQTQEDIQHIGPTAQDFSRIFNYGNSERVIHSIDSDGVLLASIQALNDQLVTIQQDLDAIQLNAKTKKDRYFEIDQTIDQLMKRSMFLDKSFQQYMYKLDQFETDYDTQAKMINYIKNVTFMMESGYYVKKINTPYVWALSVFIGLFLMIVGHLIWGKRKSL